MLDVRETYKHICKMSVTVGSNLYKFDAEKLFITFIIVKRGKGSKPA